MNRIAQQARRHAIRLPRPFSRVLLSRLWPYFHSGSAQSLCKGLTRSDERPEYYVYGDVKDRVSDFDRVYNGYPEEAPDGFNDVYDSTIRGLSKTGHDEGIFLKQGVEMYTPPQKADIIHFLQTL